MILIPSLGAISLAFGTLAQRTILKKRKVSIEAYQILIFSSIVVSIIPFIFFNWYISPEFHYEIKNYLIFIGVIFFSILANYFTFVSMKKENLVKLESAKITEPLFVILIVFLLSFIIHDGNYPRNYSILIPALIAAIALILGHIKKDHLKFTKPYRYALLGSLFFAIELVMSKSILEHFNPLTFYFIRSSFILLTYLAFFRPNSFGNLDKKLNLEIFGTGIIWVFYRLMIYLGYKQIGITETTLIIMTAPIIIYLYSWKIFKNKITLKNIITSTIVLLCVLYTIIL